MPDCLLEPINLRNGVYAGKMYVRSLIRSSVRPYVRTNVRTYVRPSRNVRKCTANKRLDLEAPVFAHVCRLSRFLRIPIFIEVLNALDLYFQGKRFESNTLASSYSKSDQREMRSSL